MAFGSLTARAARSGDPQAFFAARDPLLRLMPYFHRWSQVAAPHLPVLMLADLCRALDVLCDAIDGGASPRWP